MPSVQIILVTLPPARQASGGLWKFPLMVFCLSGGQALLFLLVEHGGCPTEREAEDAVQEHRRHKTLEGFLSAAVRRGVFRTVLSWSGSAGNK